MAVALPSYALNITHSIGIPWFAAIPVAAVLFRGVLMYYITAKPSRRRLITRTNLNALIEARTIADLRPILTDTELRSSSPLGYRIKIFLRSISSQNATGRPYGGAVYNFGTIVNLSVFLAFTESIRRICGARDGLLSLLLSPIQSFLSRANPTNFPPAADKAVENLVSRLEQAYEQALASGADTQRITYYLQQVKDRAPSAIDESSPYFDPAIREEGLAWCQDLAMVDPTHALPLALAVVIVVNMMIRPGRQGPLLSFKGTPRWLRYFSISFATAIGYISMNIPAGVVLYMTSSQLITLGQRLVLNRTMPLPQKITRCARATRSKARSTALRA